MINSADIRRFAGSAALALLLFWLCCTTFFPHRHFADGEILVHSHPFSGNPYEPNHTHSQSQLLSIAHLSSLLATVAAVICLAVVYRQRSTVLTFEDKDILRAPIVPGNPLRGPPAR